MAFTQVMLFTAVAMVVAASMMDGAGRRLCEDEHDPDPSCGTKKVKDQGGKIKCNFVVTHTKLRVEKPLSQDADVGADCNYDKQGVVHNRICSKCGDEHTPCTSTFTSCRGSPSNHVPLSEHSCQLIKGYFSRREAREACKVELRPPKNDEAWQEPDVTEEVFAGEILQASCNVTLNQHDCPRVPARVDFECNQCNKGSPSLLKDCCDECVKFAKSSKLANLTTVLPFVVCNGCDTKIIFMPSHDRAKAAIETDPASKYWESWVHKGGQTMPWFAAGGYQNYSATAAQAKMNGWIEANICNAFEPETCGADHEYPGGQQEVQASTATTTSRITSTSGKVLKKDLDNKTFIDKDLNLSSSSFGRCVTVTLMVVAGLVV